MDKYKCKICGKEFDHYRQLGGHMVYHSSNKTEIINKIKTSGTLPRVKVNKICPKCGAEFVVERIVNGTENSPQRDEKIYCSRKCANGHIQTEEQNTSRKKKLTKPKRYCFCGNLLSKRNSSGFCHICIRKQPEYRLAISKGATGKCGGYREKGGRGKQGRYKGYYCNSSWELAYVIYCLEHDIHIRRNTEGFTYLFEEKQYRYYPDFILDDGSFVEVKGYLDAKNKAKIKQFSGVLQVIGKKEIIPYLQYVVEKYGNDFIRLYE